MKSYDDILATCLAEIEAGATPEDVLSRYPEHFQRLESDLRVFGVFSSRRKAQVPAAASIAGRLALRGALAQARAEGGCGVHSPIGGIKMRLAIAFAAGVSATLAAVMFGGMLDSSGGAEVHADAYEECILQLDFNDDGLLDVNDVVAFRDAIENQDPAFDLNGDGVVDVFDAVSAVNGVVECLQTLQPPALP
ncbi:MAG TPA: hypothetical protein VMR52_07200 [Dehalococcoidia bacterium]|nr:hypothetical protein [Dehalococcoidia bacterium]